MDKDCLTKRRGEYAAHLVRCADTVSLLRPDEVNEIHKRAAAGEFDADLDWRSPHLDAPVSRGEFPCAGGPE